MRQDKDRSSKWLLSRHGDAILKLAGITGFTQWRHLPSELIAPRRLLDGLLEVRFAGDTEPTLVLIEIESYADSDADRQVFEDLMLVAVEHRTVPEVLSLVLKPKGNVQVRGGIERVSRRGTTRLQGAWPVVRLWELDADRLLNDPDIGLVPWVSLAKTELSPDQLVARCVERLNTVPDATERAGLLAVTEILAGLAFPDRRFRNLFGGLGTVIESPILDEVKEILRLRYLADGLRDSLARTLEIRFGPLDGQQASLLNGITDPDELKQLLEPALKCPDLASFFVELGNLKPQV